MANEDNLSDRSQVPANEELRQTIQDTRLSLQPTIPATGASDPDQTTLPEPSQPRYKSGGSIARGAMGEIREAKEVPVGRRVAMKVIHDQQRNEALVRARFIEEAQITGQLEHPSIVPMHDLGVDENGHLFYTMKLVDGETLAAILARIAEGDAETVQAYPLSRLLTLFQKICDAVAFAHSRGVIHRDLKPENVMVGDYGEVLVMDWGLAKVTDLPDLSNSLADNPETEEGGFRTLDGDIMGTIGYMPPEQAEGRTEDVGIPSDIYALGAILYEILTLRRTILATSVSEGLRKTLEAEIPDPLEVAKAGQLKLPQCPGGQVPGSLAAVTMRSLEWEPQSRYESVQDLQGEIEAYQNGFATAAEEASFWKHLLLFIRRHRVETIAALLIGMTVVAGTVVSALGWKAAEGNRKLAEENEVIAIDRSIAMARQISRDWVEKGDRMAEAEDPNGALLRYAEAFRVATELGEISEEEEWVHRFRIGQYIGMAPKYESITRSLSGSRFLRVIDEKRGIVYSGAQGKIKVTDRRTWEQVGEIGLPTESNIPGPISAGEDRIIAFSRVGTNERETRLFVIGLGNGAVDDAEVRVLEHDTEILTAGVLPNKDRVVTIEASGQANLWDLLQLQRIARFRVSEVTLIGASLNLVDGSVIGAGSVLREDSKKIGFVFSLEPQFGPSREIVSGSFAPLETLAFQKNQDFRVSLHPAGKLVAFAWHGKEGGVFDVESGERVERVDEQGQILDVHFCSDGRHILTRSGEWAETEALLERWDQNSFRPAERILPQGSVRSGGFAISPVENRVMVHLPALKSFRLIEIPSLRPLPISFRRSDAGFIEDSDSLLADGFALKLPLPGRGPSVLSAKSSPLVYPPILDSTGDRILFNEDPEEASRRHLVWKVSQSKEENSVDWSTVPTDNGIPRRGAFDPESGTWWLASHTHVYRQTKSGKFEAVSLGDPCNLGAVQPYGSLLIAKPKNDPSKRQIWHGPEGRLIKELSGFSRGADWARALPDPSNRYVIFHVGASPGFSFRLYDLKRDRTMEIPQMRDTPLISHQDMQKVAFSNDSRWLMIRNEVYQIHDGDVESVGRLAVQFSGNCNVTFSRDGKICALTDTRHRVHLYSVPELKRTTPLLEHSTPVSRITFSLDGRFLATAAEDGKIRLWDISSGQLVSFPLDSGERNSHCSVLRFTPDEKHLLARISDGVYLWSLSEPTEANSGDLVTAAQILSREQLGENGLQEPLSDEDWLRLKTNAPKEAQRLRAFAKSPFVKREFSTCTVFLVV
ncbi:MAG: serine/threonine-protein kinase [Verrucomicrobiota bacterium]